MLCDLVRDRCVAIPEFRNSLLHGSLLEDKRFPALLEEWSVDKTIDIGIGEAVEPLLDRSKAELLGLERRLSLILPTAAEIGNKAVQLCDLLGLELQLGERPLHLILDSLFADTLGDTATGMASIIHMSLLYLADQPPPAEFAIKHTAKQEHMGAAAGVELSLQDRLNLIEERDAYKGLMGACECLGGTTEFE